MKYSEIKETSTDLLKVILDKLQIIENDFDRFEVEEETKLYKTYTMIEAEINRRDVLASLRYTSLDVYPLDVQLGWVRNRIKYAPIWEIRQLDRMIYSLNVLIEQTEPRRKTLVAIQTDAWTLVGF